MAAQSLYDLLNSCVVLVTIPAKKVRGTGFFVAPGKILTCAHVVEPARTNNLPIEISWQGQTLPAQIQQFRDVAATDLALLEVNLTNHPCVLLYCGAEPRNHLYSFGFPDIEDQGASTTFESEGWAGSQLERLKFQQGQARPGMSGSPLLNWDTGSVCGIVQLSYSTSSAAAVGGSGLLTKIILQEFPELQEQQKQYHQQHREWIDSMTPQQRQKAGLIPSTPVPGTTETFEIFFSYAEEDEKLVNELRKQLSLLKRRNLITDWYAGKIVPQPGVEPDAEILSHLNSADIILLLISPDFIFSQQLNDVDVKRAMERHDAKEATVIPVLLRPTSDLEEDAPFGKLLSIPRNGRPVTEWSNRDAAFAEIAKEIRNVVEALKKQANPQSAPNI
jgi:Trypsin-like peptidase domain/TIR domain